MASEESTPIVFNPKNRFRIDQVIVDSNELEIVRFSVAGETLDQALMGSQRLVAPHIHEGLYCKVVRIGYFCPEHGCYHDVSTAIIGDAAAQEVVTESGLN